MFQNSRHIQISGNPRFTYNDNKSSLGLESLDEGIRLLLSRVVKGAMHNSGERFDAPTCHVETRTAIQEDILGWADEPLSDLNKAVTWLHGPAGAGKSAIAQTIAQKLHARGQLTASFFFSRASGSGGRGAETDLVATLAHQLSQSVPATKPHIAAAVRQNPLVFDLALQDQVDALIVVPLITASRSLSGASRPRVIVVDGLDECRKEKDAQRRVVDALMSALRQIPHHTHKLFITSRPEDNIVTIFSRYDEKLLRRMELNDDWDPDRDIRAFLNASFADIRRSHFYFRSRPVDGTWPEPDAIDTLVRRSSGQFIYASVVLKYIRSEENYSPVTRLKIILSLTNNDDRPYAELDALYEYVFSQIRDTDRLRVLIILSLDQNYGKFAIDHTRPKPPLSTFLSEFIGVDMDEIKFCLLPLVSLLVWKEESEGEGNNSSEGEKLGGIHYMHASLVDFILDQSRSHVFYINSLTIAVDIVRRAVEWLEDGTALKRPDHMPTMIAIPPHYTRLLQSDQEFHIHLLVSDFNVVETMLCKIDAEFIQSGNLPIALNSYLVWVLEESTYTQGENSSNYLSKSAAQIRKWLVNQFEHLRFNSLDYTERIDLRPFFARYSLADRRTSIKRLSEDLSAALEICGSAPTYHHIQRGTTLSLSRDTAVLCYLMSESIVLHASNSWFFRPDLLDQYAAKSEHHGVALQCIAYYLLQLPKDTLLEVLNDANPEKGILETPIMRLIREVLNQLLSISPPTTDLYFLVVLTYPVMRSIDINCSVSYYLSEALDEFPFLTDRESSDFILAKAQLAEACSNLTSTTSLHELAEMGRIKMDYDFDEWQKVEYEELLGAFAIIDKIPESG